MTNALEQIWLRQPAETDKAWLAFETYRNLPPFGEKDARRSLVNAARILGYKDDQMMTRWSTKYSWVDRVRAYDASLGAKAMDMREVGIESYHREVYRSLTAQLAVADTLLDKTLSGLMQRAEKGDHIPSVELQRIIRAIKEKDDLARRAGGLPVEFKTTKAEEFEENEYYVIGEASESPNRATEG